MKLTAILKKSFVAILFCQASVLCVLGSSVEELATKADAIIIGTVTTRTESQGSVSFDIVPERILKGPAAFNGRVLHSWSGKLRGRAQTIDITLRGIWFLVRSSAPEWELLTARPQWHGMIPSLYFPVGILSADYRYQAGSPLLDVLTFEVAAGLESAGESSGSQAGILIALGDSKALSTQTVLNHLVNSPTPGSQLVGLAGVLSRGQRGSIAELSRRWPVIGNDANRQLVINAVRDSFRDTSPDNVQQLATLAGATSTPTDLKDAAVHALASIHTKEALPLLAGLLSSTDPEERMKGVSGLAAFANGCPQQTPGNVASMEYLQFRNLSPFRTVETMANFAFRRGPEEQETRLVSYWLNWWNLNKASVGAN